MNFSRLSTEPLYDLVTVEVKAATVHGHRMAIACMHNLWLIFGLQLNHTAHVYLPRRISMA
jgi:hypothetical protein